MIGRDKPGSGRPTLEDVALRAGVGIATVDRVLNERGNVSQRTAERVLEAARDLKLRRVLPARHHRTLRIEALLARPELPLIRRMGEEFGALIQRIDRSVVIHRSYLKSEAPALLAERIRQSSGDGIVVYAQEHPAIEAAIEAANASGKAVVTMISDLPGTRRLAYAGTDHVAAGRTAGYFMARMARGPGPVLVLCNHLGFQSHAARVRGFSDALACHGTGLEVFETIEGGDDQQVAEPLLRRAAERHPEAVGIYNVGAANRAVAAVIRDRLFARPPIFIGHELTPFTRPMLRDGIMTLAIDQNPEQQARFAIDVLMRHFGIADMNGIAPRYHSDVPFTLYGPENV